MSWRGSLAPRADLTSCKALAFAEHVPQLVKPETLELTRCCPAHRELTWRVKALSFSHLVTVCITVVLLGTISGENLT